jgi:hypothetical protein
LLGFVLLLRHNALYDRQDILEANVEVHNVSLERGFVNCERRGAAPFFSTMVERKAFITQQFQTLANNNFCGSLAPLLSTLAN